MCRPRNHSMEEPLYVTFWAILVYVGVLMIALECIVVTIFLIRHRITRRKEGAPEESNRPNRPGRRQGRENRGPPPLNVTREHMLNYNGGVPQGIDNSQFILASRSPSPENLPNGIAELATATQQPTYFVIEPLNNDTLHPQYVC